MRLERGDLIATDGELAALCVAQGLPAGPLSVLPVDKEGDAGLATGVEGAPALDEDLWHAVRGLRDPARCLEVRQSVGDEVATRSLLAWPRGADRRLAVLEVLGHERRIGLRSERHVRVMIRKSLVSAPPSPPQAKRLISTKAALAFIAVADHLRLARLMSMVEQRPPAKRFTASNIRARFESAGADDFRWPLNFVDKLWPQPLATHEAARDVAGALDELDRAGLLTCFPGGTEPTYEAIGQGEMVATTLDREETKLCLGARTPAGEAGAGPDVALIVRSRTHVALIHMGARDAVVRLLDLADLDDWLARVIVCTEPVATPAPSQPEAAAAGPSSAETTRVPAVTMNLSAVQTLVMKVPPAALRLAYVDDTEGRVLTLSTEGTLGRQADNSVVISEPGVSRRHACFHRDERGLWFVTDLETANGTYVNDRRISKATTIQAGDVIRVSETRLRVMPSGD